MSANLFKLDETSRSDTSSDERPQREPRPSFSEADFDAVRVLMTTRPEQVANEVARFEKALAQMVGAKHAVGYSSTGGAVETGIAALGLDPGDLVILPALAPVAVANAVRSQGVHIVFADVDPLTGLLTTDTLAAAARDLPATKLKAVIAVYLDGRAPDMPALAEFSASREIALLEAAGTALGTTYRDRSGKVCTAGQCRHAKAVLLSFDDASSDVFGGLGAVVTDDEDFEAALRLFRNQGVVDEPNRFVDRSHAEDIHGNKDPFAYEQQALGFDSTPSPARCLLGRLGLDLVGDRAEQQRALAKWYDGIFAEIELPGLSLVPRTPGANASAYPVQIAFESVGAGRINLLRTLLRENVAAKPATVPLHLQPCHKGIYGERRLNGAEAYYARTVLLPTRPGTSLTDADRAAGVIEAFLEKTPRQAGR